MRLAQIISSERSPQSSELSQVQISDMHLPLEQRKSFLPQTVAAEREGRRSLGMCMARLIKQKFETREG